MTEKAAGEVKRIVAEQDAGTTRSSTCRVRVVGGGCCGFQNKLDLDPTVNEKLDEKSRVPRRRRSSSTSAALLYLDGVTVDFHDDLNKRGFSITNPSAKSTCGCGSSFSM